MEERTAGSQGFTAVDGGRLANRKARRSPTHYVNTRPRGLAAPAVHARGVALQHLPAREALGAR